MPAALTGAPFPRNRTRCPSLTPAGMRALTVVDDAARPEP